MTSKSAEECEQLFNDMSRHLSERDQYVAKQVSAALILMLMGSGISPAATTVVLAFVVTTWQDSHKDEQ